MFLLIVLAIILAIAAWFVFSIIKYVQSVKEDEKYMESRKFALANLLVSAFFFFSLIGLIIVFSMGLAHM